MNLTKSSHFWLFNFLFHFVTLTGPIIYLSTLCLFIYLSICLFIYLSYLYIFLSLYFLCFCTFPWPILLKIISYPQPISLATSNLFRLFSTFWINQILIFLSEINPPLHIYFNANCHLNFENLTIFYLFILIFTFTFNCINHINFVCFTQVLKILQIDFLTTHIINPGL